MLGLFFFVMSNVWNTHEEYLVVFIIAQYLVGIDAASSFDNMLAFIFNEFGHNARPQWNFWRRLYTVNGEQPYRGPQRAPCV